MEWVAKLVRMAGVTNPFTAPFVQLQAEIDATVVEKRLKKLEDPISHLHQDVPVIAQIIYKELFEKDSVNLEFDDDFYTNYKRALTLLANNGLISLSHGLGKSIPSQVNLIGPSFILYMCANFEDPKKMNKIIDLVDGCKPGKTINAVELSESLGIPKFAIRAVFLLYEANDLGFCTGGHTKLRYQGKA